MLLFVVSSIVVEQFPYDLPVFRRQHQASSPDGRHVAWMSAREISMSNPTIGALHLSGGTIVENCNPSFLWSDDSRYLAIPQYRFVLGVQLRQRILILEPIQRLCFVSPPRGWYLQPESFQNGLLVVIREPASRTPKEMAWSIPTDLRRFRQKSLS